MYANFSMRLVKFVKVKSEKYSYSWTENSRKCHAVTLGLGLTPRVHVGFHVWKAEGETNQDGPFFLAPRSPSPRAAPTPIPHRHRPLLPTPFIPQHQNRPCSKVIDKPPDPQFFSAPIFGLASQFDSTPNSPPPPRCRRRRLLNSTPLRCCGPLSGRQ